MQGSLLFLMRHKLVQDNKKKIKKKYRIRKSRNLFKKKKEKNINRIKSHVYKHLRNTVYYFTVECIVNNRIIPL